MRLRVSTEVEPAVFDEAELASVGGRILQRVHKGWLSLDLEPERLGQLTGLRGVLDTLLVVACDDRLDLLPAGLEWRELAVGDCHGLVDFRIEQGVAGGRVVALRQTATAKAKVFLRSHRTEAMDLTLWMADGTVPGGRRVVVRHSDGLRDHSVGGMHDWKPGDVWTITMWVGHLPAGTYGLLGGVDGLVRVKTKLEPWTLAAEVRLGTQV